MGFETNEFISTEGNDIKKDTAKKNPANLLLIAGAVLAAKIILFS